MDHSERIKTQFAPTGVLRVALNYGNPILVGRDDAGAPTGISVDLALALADALGLAPRFVGFARAAEVTSTATADLWDICFLAVDPERSGVLDFTDPYVAIEGRYLAGPRCQALDAAALVASGAPVGVVNASAYALALARMPGKENLVVFPSIEGMLAALDAGRIAAVAGISGVMAAVAKTRPGSRVLTPRFMDIQQAMAIVQGRPDATAYLRGFVAGLARRGIVGDILERHGVARDCAIVPDQPGLVTGRKPYL
ncbi:MAG: transporter substrate-binding domain-containing protein [Rhodospirillum sp.]|nr:transporter substrate-binding domain-containing protein [Rhodospirillum sp.]